MPNDLISRDALLSKLKPAAIPEESDCVTEHDVLFAPAVDAVEVVHARWIICSDGYYPYCSACKAEPKSRELTNYCPNCWAKMDLNGKDDNE